MNNKVDKIYKIKEICWFNCLCACSYTRMTPERFEHVLSMVGPRIKKKDTETLERKHRPFKLTILRISHWQREYRIEKENSEPQAADLRVYALAQWKS